MLSVRASANPSARPRYTPNASRDVCSGHYFDHKNPAISFVFQWLSILYAHYMARSRSLARGLSRLPSPVRSPRAPSCSRQRSTPARSLCSHIHYTSAFDPQVAHGGRVPVIGSLALVRSSVSCGVGMCREAGPAGVARPHRRPRAPTSHTPRTMQHACSHCHRRVGRRAAHDHGAREGRERAEHRHSKEADDKVAHVLKVVVDGGDYVP